VKTDLYDQLTCDISNIGFKRDVHVGFKRDLNIGVKRDLGDEFAPFVGLLQVRRRLIPLKRDLHV